MKTIGKIASWLVVLLLVGGPLAGAEPSRNDTRSVPEQQGERRVRVNVDKMISIAIGERAVANTHIADSPAQSAADGKGTVHVGTIYHKAVGHKASVCIQIPFVADSGTCN